MASAKNSTEKIVRRVFAKHFKKANLADVIVVPDFDSDGDRIEWVTVVFDYPEKATGDKLAEFITRLHASLPADAAFPVVSFRSAGDHQGMRAEAA